MIIPNIWENKKCSKPPTSSDELGIRADVLPRPSTEPLGPWDQASDVPDASASDAAMTSGANGKGKVRLPEPAVKGGLKLGNVGNVG